MEQKIFRYQIGGKTYIQRSLGPGQSVELINIVQQAGIELPDSLTPAAIAKAIGPHMPIIAACVLRNEEGAIPWLKMECLNGITRITADAELFSSFAMELAQQMDNDFALQGIEDFFACNPILSLFEKLTGMAEKAIKSVMKVKTEANSNTLKSSQPVSRAETLQSEMPSSGATALRNADRS